MGPLHKLIEQVEYISYLYKWWAVIEGQVRRDKPDTIQFMKDRGMPHVVETSTFDSLAKLGDLIVEIHTTTGEHVGNWTFMDIDGQPTIFFEKHKMASLFALLC